MYCNYGQCLNDSIIQSYNHSMLAEEYPKINSRKADVQKWLQNKSIPFIPKETLSELREKVKLSMSKEKNIN